MQHSRDKFEDLVRRGELAAFKVGRRTYVAKEEAERWLRETRSLKKVKVSHADDQTPDLLPGQNSGSRRHPAAKSGKRQRQPIDGARHNA
jgi:hypothetical protein